MTAFTDLGKKGVIPLLRDADGIAACLLYTSGILGGMASYPLAAWLMNNKEAALFTFVPSFLVSTAVGALISVIVLSALKRTSVFGQLEGSLR